MTIYRQITIIPKTSFANHRPCIMFPVERLTVVTCGPQLHVSCIRSDCSWLEHQDCGSTSVAGLLFVHLWIPDMLPLRLLWTLVLTGTLICHCCMV